MVSKIQTQQPTTNKPQQAIKQNTDLKDHHVDSKTTTSKVQ